MVIMLFMHTMAEQEMINVCRNIGWIVVFMVYYPLSLHLMHDFIILRLIIIHLSLMLLKIVGHCI